MTRVTLENVDAVAGQLTELKGEIDSAVQAGLLAGGEAIAAEAKRLVLRQRDPSRPLPSPLADSIKVNDLPGETGVRVGTNVSYAIYVEFGTQRIPAAPFLGPAVQLNRGRLAAMLAGKVNQILRGNS